MWLLLVLIVELLVLYNFACLVTTVMVKLELMLEFREDVLHLYLGQLVFLISNQLLSFILMNMVDPYLEYMLIVDRMLDIIPSLVTVDLVNLRFIYMLIRHLKSLALRIIDVR